MQKNALCGWSVSIALGNSQRGRYVTKTLLVMKLTIILLTAAIVQVSAKGLSQTVSFTGKNVPFQEVLSAIEKQTNFEVLYNPASLNKANPVSLNTTNLPLKDFLQLLFKDQPLDYSIRNTSIVIFSKRQPASDENNNSNNESAILPPSPIRGRVLDTDGKPLAGATLSIKNSKTSGVTDADGVFLINVSEGDIVRVSYVGYSGLSFKVQGRGGTMTAIVLSYDRPSSTDNGFSSLVNSSGTDVSLTITLKRAEDKLDEVVVNKGYYTEKKIFNTGNVSKVNASAIEKSPVSNVLSALQARVPGMVIIQNTGVPGGSFFIQIRGKNSIGYGNNPLYIIDGVPFISNSIASQIAQSPIPNSNPLNNINPLDIENIEILKDADATSIYGSRGAHGVVLITTKKGKGEKTKVEINAYQGMGKVAKKMDLLNTQQYLEMRHEAFKNDNATPQFWDYDLTTWDTTRYTDWQRELIGGTSNTSDAQVSVSGGGNTTHFLLSGAYHRETTVFPGDFANQKASAHFSLDHISYNKKFKASITTNYGIQNNELPGLDITRNIVLPPNTPSLRDSAGNLNWPVGVIDNPYTYLLQKYKSKTNNLVSNVILNYVLFPGLEIRTSLGYTMMQMDELSTTPLTSLNPGYGYTSGGSVFANSNNTSWIIEPQVEYKTKIGQGTLTALIGSSLQQNDLKAINLYANKFTSDALLENIAAAASVTVQNNNITQYKYQAILGRINYNWMDKYFINLTGRRDGSSRFGPDKRFANFGAIGVAWIISNEDFFKNNTSLFSFAKLRSSYGITGNDQIGDYKYLNLFANVYYPYQGTLGLIPTNLFNPDYGWENTNKLEIALELGILKDRIRLEASYYRNKSSNQLIASPLPPTTGFNSILANSPAIVQNTGWEFQLNTENVRANNFSWSTSFNLTIPRNKLLAYPNLATSSLAYVYTIGKSLNVRQLFQFTGVDPQTGVYTFKDVDEDGNLSYPNDLQSLKQVGQQFYGGLQNSFQFKGFELDILFQFVKQTGINYLSTFGSGVAAPGFMSNQPVEVLKRWQKEGDQSGVQKFTQSYSSDAFAAYINTRYYGDNVISDASFVRLKNLSLSYRLPSKWIQKLKMSGFKLYIQGQNLLTFTNFLGMDPENQNTATLPPLRVLTGGVQITF